MFDNGGLDAGPAGNADSGRRQGTKRRKYTARACRQCKRRKVKCSGEDACQQCRSRDMPCRYSPAAPDQSRAAPAQLPYTEHASASRASTGLVGLGDPRFDQLCDRVKAIERTLAYMLESAKGKEDQFPGGTFQTPSRTRAADDYDVDANQFTPHATAHHDLSLSSQVAAMSALLSRPPSPGPGCGKPSEKVEIVIELPNPLSLQHLLNVYFHDFDAYFPLLDRQDTESRIHSVIRLLGYSSYNCVLVVPIEHLSTIALTCVMLALAECIDPGEGACDGDTKPGWDKYLQGHHAIQHLSRSKTLDLDTVGAQCLVAAYLMHCEILNMASQAVFVAWQLAMSIHLNNKKDWPTEDAKEIQQRQRLWWTIYFLDRQISRRSGIAYHIRDTEFDVDDFTTTENGAGSSPAPQGGFSSTSRSYLQALVTTAKLWGHVWDTFFAIGATKKEDWMEIEIMDARILNTHRQLPAALTWDSDQLANYALSGEDEPHTRRRLQIYTRFTLLRMLIRQNPVRQATFNPETAHFCSRLSREVITAHELFVSRYPGVRASGYFTTSSIVECIYHLAPVMRYSNDNEEHACCILAFNQARGILDRISAYNKVAKKALTALNGLIRKWGSDTTVEDSRGERADTRQDRGSGRNITDTPQVHDPQGINLQLGAEGFGADFGDWMGISMGSLFGNDVDFRPATGL